MGLAENTRGGFAEENHLGQLRMTEIVDEATPRIEAPGHKPHIEFPKTRSQVGEIAISAYDTEPGELPFVSPSHYR